MNIHGIIQARTSSTRFPNKIMYKIKEKTLLELYIDRVKQSKLLNKIIVATTTNPNDDIICGLVNREYENELGIFRGSEFDVLGRYYECAKEWKSDIVVRLTPDDFFVESQVIDKAIKIMVDGGYDYVTNHFLPSYPEGIDIEVYKFKTLERLNNNAKLKSEREHVFTYIYNNQKDFNFINFKNNIDCSSYRWTLDHIEDFNLVKRIYELFDNKKEMFHMDDILELYKQYPELKDINGHIKRKEGVNKSIVEDGGEPI